MHIITQLSFMKSHLRSFLLEHFCQGSMFERTHQTPQIILIWIFYREWIDMHSQWKSMQASSRPWEWISCARFSRAQFAQDGAKLSASTTKVWVRFLRELPSGDSLSNQARSCRLLQTDANHQCRKWLQGLPRENFSVHHKFQYPDLCQKSDTSHPNILGEIFPA